MRLQSPLPSSLRREPKTLACLQTLNQGGGHFFSSSFTNLRPPHLASFVPLLGRTKKGKRGEEEKSHLSVSNHCLFFLPPLFLSVQSFARDRGMMRGRKRGNWRGVGWLVGGGPDPFPYSSTPKADRFLPPSRIHPSGRDSAQTWDWIRPIPYLVN